MSTKQAQQAAHAAWLQRVAEAGGKRITTTLTADGLSALQKLAPTPRDQAAAINAALISAASRLEKVPVQVLDVDAEYRLQGPTVEVVVARRPPEKPAAKSATKPVKVDLPVGPQPVKPGQLAKRSKAK